MTKAPQFKIFYSNILNPKSDHKCDYFYNGVLVLKKHIQDDSYTVYFLGSHLSQEQETFIKKKTFRTYDYRNYYLMPGFYDMHFHWVQDKVRTMPKDNLLNWLSRYTWPAEEKFKEKKYSHEQAQRFFKKLSRQGTVGGAIYSSIHAHALEHALQFSQGNYIAGNVLMTMNSPKYLRQSKTNALKLVERLSKKYKKRYALTPRFAPTCHPEVMRAGAKMARSQGSFIQTHLSETTEEVQYVLSLFRKFPGYEKVKSYTEVYKKAGLLGKKTIMGHGIHLDQSEWSLLSQTGTAIAHCPTSNDEVVDLGLGSGLFSYRQAEKHAVPWALGSDIGAGPFLCMLDVMRSFVEQNRKKGHKKATYTKALFRSTLAGATILGLDKKGGNLDQKKSADFILVKPQAKIRASQVEQIFQDLCESPQRQKLHQQIKKTFFKGAIL